MGWRIDVDGAGCAGTKLAKIAGAREQKQNTRETRQAKDLPVARLRVKMTLELRALGLGLAVSDLLVDVDVLGVLGRLRAAALFFVDADLFLDVLLAARLLLLVDGGREGFVRLFVTFPSVCLRLR